MKATRIGPHIRAFTNRVRHFSFQAQVINSSIVFVKDVQIRQNSLLGPTDKQFPLPGDVCPKILFEEQASLQQSLCASKQNTQSIEELLSSSQIAADPNYSARLQEAMCEKPDVNTGDWPVELSVQECPRLLKKEMKHLFPGMNFDNAAITVLNITQKTENDMKIWSEKMEQEREMLTASFISSALVICTTLRRSGYWADFIDPSSGRPYLGKFTNHTLFETDDAYKQMGFRIEDLGCCKVLQHVSWGTRAFVGTLFTDAPTDCSIVQDIIQKVNTDDMVDNNNK